MNVRTKETITKTIINMKIALLNYEILVTMIEDPNTVTKGGIILPGSQNNAYLFCKIYQIGRNVNKELPVIDLYNKLMKTEPDKEHIFMIEKRSHDSSNPIRGVKDVALYKILPEAIVAYVKLEETEDTKNQ